MERVNIVVLASLAAALTLFALRVVTDNAGPHFLTRADVNGPVIGPDTTRDRRLPRSRIAMYGGDAGEPGQPPQAPTPGVEQRRAAGRAAASGQSELIAGYERRRDVLRSAWRADLDESEIVEREPLDVLIARSAAIPRAGAASAPPAPSEPGVIEFGDDPPPQDQGGADVLLRIPFDGGLDAEVGGGPFQVEGVVTGDGTVDFPEEARLSFPSGGNVNSATGTISFEVRPHWAGADDSNNSLVQIRNEHVWENTLSIVKNEQSLRFIIIDSGGVERNVNIPIQDWGPGESHNLAATWDASSMVLYVNGQQVGQTSLPNPLQFSESTPIFIGSDYPGSTYVGAGGSIREFVVYARALSADEIAR